MCQKACAVEASLIDAPILEWNSMCTATCGVSTTETGGSSSDNCANNTEKNKKRVRMKFFLVVRTSQCKIPKLSSANSFGWFFTHQ